jgi:predicted AAA+ superfamily ATPase
MIKKLAESTMDEVSFNRIKNIIQSKGIKVGTTTLIDYFSYLEESFLLRSVHNFRKKISERETKRKYYFRDHGLLGLFINDPESIILETIVYNHLIRKYPDDVYYIKDKYETDFYIQNKQLIQVCYNITSEETRKKEINALVKANNQVKAGKGLIVTMDHEEVVVEADLEISIVPVWKWILGNKQT